jgi:predicted DCC family thiol-disulfide oxidoreductase YuxK
VLRVRVSPSHADPAPDSVAHPILLYDGVCGLCNRLVQFILRRDRDAIFRFASLQSPLAAAILSRHGASPEALDTFYVVINYNQPDESLLPRSDAVVFVLKKLGGIYRPAAAVFQRIPRTLRDWIYSVIARTRYQIFGRYDTCPIPTEDTRSRFLDQ